MIKVVLENEEEAEFDHATDLAEAYADVTPRVTRKDPLKASADDFCGLDKESLREAATYEMRYGKEEGDIIVWKILQDSDSIDLGMPDMDGDSRFKRNIDLNEDTDLGDVFFAEFFPSIIGHAKLIDEYHADPRSAYYSTTINDNIIFHDENAQDPDWKVQQAYLLLIAAASEVENGIENLWKRGKSTGRHDYPNFGQFMPINYFKAFVAAAAYCWADRKFWYIDKRDRPWDIFLPCLKEYNERRKRLIHSICLILDESMSGWRPKTSKLGGLPNYTFEPIKPVPLETMFRNGMCCLSGIFAYQDVVMNPEMQASKEFFKDDSHLPDGSIIPSHTAEVLRQIKGADLRKDCSWLGGDAWFGSVCSAVEAQVRFGSRTTFIIKNNTHLFPMQALHAVLRARYGDRPAGHWVVFHATISNVKLMAVVYGWSQRGLSYFISTAGSTELLDEKYISSFEDNFGNMVYREINRPKFAHFLYDNLPLIDEANKQRQSVLNLENCWSPKDCWFKLLITLTAMSVVDMHRWHQHKTCAITDAATRASSLITSSRQPEYNLRLRKFSDVICVKLDKRKWNHHAQRSSRISRVGAEVDEEPLIRLRNKDGNCSRDPTVRQIKIGRTTGNTVTSNCFVCRKYLKVNGMTAYHTTSFCCRKCTMPLCKLDRSGQEGRTSSCCDEHLCSDESPVWCNDVFQSKTEFPKEKQVYLHPRRSVRTRLEL